MTKNENDNPPGDIVYKDGDLIPELHPLFTPAMSTKTIDLYEKQMYESHLKYNEHSTIYLWGCFGNAKLLPPSLTAFKVQCCRSKPQLPFRPFVLTRLSMIQNTWEYMGVTVKEFQYDK